MERLPTSILPCPSCGATSGSPCRAKNGEIVEYHRERVQAAGVAERETEAERRQESRKR